MNINIRLPCGQRIAVKIDTNDTILLLKEKICLTNILFIKEHFHLYFPGQEQPLHDEIYLLSLPETPFLQMIPDTLDVSKVTYDVYSCSQRNVTPVCNSTVDDLIDTFSNIPPNKSIRIYTSSTMPQSTTHMHSSPIRPNVPSVPKAVMGTKSFQYNYNSGCMIL